MPKRLKQFLALSFILHIIALFVFWHNPPIKNLDKKDYKVTWLKLSKGDGGTSTTASYKNSKTLPQSTIREKKHAIKELSKDKKGSDLESHESKTKKTAQQKKSLKKTSEKGGINISKKNKTTKKKVYKKTKIDDALARIDQELKQREVDMTVAQAKTGETGQSPFGSDKGSVVDPNLITYYNTIKKKIKREWVVSKNEFSGTLVAKIVVMIDSNGKILKSRIKRPSGDGSFDASAMRAVKRSAPFPSPPTSIRSEVLTEGFIFEFNPRTVAGRI